MPQPLQTRTITGPAGPLAVFCRNPEGDRSPSEPIMVLVHGIQGTAAAWSALMDALPENIGAVAPNLRGRAGSVVPREPSAYSLEGFGRDLAAVIHVLNAPVVLVGWSMGVLVTLTHLRDHGLTNVRGVALVGGSACPDGRCPWFQGDDVESVVSEAQARAAALGLKECADPIAVAGAWLAARDADLRSTLPRLSVPTLIIHGDRDDQCPVEHARAMAAAIANARLEIVVGGGHQLPADDPAFVANMLAALYRSVRGA